MGNRQDLHERFDPGAQSVRDALARVAPTQPLSRTGTALIAVQPPDRPIEPDASATLGPAPTSIGETSKCCCPKSSQQIAIVAERAARNLEWNLLSAFDAAQNIPPLQIGEEQVDSERKRVLSPFISGYDRCIWLSRLLI